MKKKKSDKVDDVAQLECSNNNCYVSAFRYIYIYIYLYGIRQSRSNLHTLLIAPLLMQGITQN